MSVVVTASPARGQAEHINRHVYTAIKDVQSLENLKSS